MHECARKPWQRASHSLEWHGLLQILDCNKLLSKVPHGRTGFDAEEAESARQAF